jgi:rfaE bifunctional protein kinase chain/domain
MSEDGMAPAQLGTILNSFNAVSVAVFGDFCLDAYWLIDSSGVEMSIETGLEIRRVREQRYTPGGAGNVVSNLIDMGVRTVRAVGIVGSDLFGVRLLGLLGSRGVDISGVLNLGERWQTMVYAKPCKDGNEQNRLDFGAFNTMNAEDAEKLLAMLERAAKQSDVVVLNQQIPRGLSSPGMIQQINRVIASHPKTRFIVDARDHAGLYRGAILKLNSREAARVLGDSTATVSGPASGTESADRQLAQSLFDRNAQPVFLTRGAHGMLVADSTGVKSIRGIQIIEATDPVGAGDTVVAALASVIAAGGDPFTAAKVANLAASVTVRKLQTTGTATPDEICQAARDADSVYEPDLAADIRHANYIEDSEIELVGELPRDIQLQHAIFDHDGTLSVLRQGWEAVMEPMMCRAVLGERFNTADATTYQNVQDRVREFIDRTTGIQTLVQMQGLVRLVSDYGFIPAEKILDEHGYKAIYNDALLKLIHTRIVKLKAGELESTDFQIKNAQPLLEALHRRGIKLYLASGTDEADVIAEAEVMGYAHLFEGRIFGAVGDVKVEAKKIVLERIILENKLKGHQFMTFGDGPVEMRETRKRGGICVGVASDEVRRFGLNLSKRTRLIRAGATLVLPDFSQMSKLLRVLQLQ